MPLTATLDRSHLSPPRGSRPKPVGATAQAAARSRSRVVVGALVLVASALAAGLLYANAGDRRPVLAVASRVEAGQAIQADDLREVLAAPVPGVRTVPGSARRTVIGRTATAGLEPGALLHPSQVAEGPLIDRSLAVVGGLLHPGQYPVGLRAGDRVLAVVLPPPGPPTPAGGEAPAPVRAVVTAVGQPAGNGLPVSLGVAPGDATDIARAGAAGLLALVVAPR